MTTEILLNIAVMLIAIVALVAIGMWIFKGEMDDAEPIQPTEADRYIQSQRKNTPKPPPEPEH